MDGLEEPEKVTQEPPKKSGGTKSVLTIICWIIGLTVCFGGGLYLGKLYKDQPSSEDAAPPVAAAPAPAEELPGETPEAPIEEPQQPVAEEQHPPVEGRPFAVEREIAADFAGVPRTIIALYDSRQFARVEYTLAHGFAEMPLNHLGLIVEYHDVRRGLPNLDHRKDVRGVLTWFRNETPYADAKAYVEWATALINQGKKFVIIGLPGFRSAAQRGALTVEDIKAFYKLMGLNFLDRWTNAESIETLVAAKPEGMELERKLTEVSAGYYHLQKADGSLTPYLKLKKKGDAKATMILASTHKNGGVVEAEYAAYSFYDENLGYDIRQWIINPFVFFADAFDVVGMPKPDTTTHLGRRIFYSHIDGDAWNGASGNCKVEGGHQSCAEAVQKQILEAYPDIPVSVAPIAGDLDPAYGGSEQAQEVTKAIFNLPHIEPSSHTYTHPMEWSALESGGKVLDANVAEQYAQQGYASMRLYNVKPFSITEEVVDARDYIQQFAPQGKEVKLVQWSGDTSPGTKTLELTAEQNLYNLNGGDSRFDTKFNSYTWVKPIGRKAGDTQQIYASNSNENTYTNGWNGPFDGIKMLKETWNNTEAPIRVKPMNLYYHMYSAQYVEGVEAIKGLLDYARTQPIIPITATHFAKIGDGFFNAEIISDQEQGWKIKNRNALQTIRFDNQAAKHVDMAKSQGVLGYGEHQGNLYVYLDAAVVEPVIALTDAKPEAAYLIQSNWDITGLKQDKGDLSFTVQGYGKGEMKWHVPKAGDYKVVLKDTDGKEVWFGNTKAEANVLTINVDADVIKPLTMTISR